MKREVIIDTDVCGLAGVYLNNRFESVHIHFNKEFLELIKSDRVVVDKVHMRIRVPNIDDSKTYKVSKHLCGGGITCTMPNRDERLGKYEITDEGDYYQLHKI